MDRIDKLIARISNLNKNDGTLKNQKQSFEKNRQNRYLKKLQILFFRIVTDGRVLLQSFVNSLLWYPLSE